jgi:hypothetical protein
MSLGKRIKDRLEEMGKDAKWLAKKTHIPVSTIYELTNGRMEGSTRLPAIAFHLGLHGMWLLDASGPRQTGESAKVEPADSYWPFKTDRSRVEKLEPEDLSMVVAVVDGALAGILGAIERRTGPRTAVKKG